MEMTGVAGGGSTPLRRIIPVMLILGVLGYAGWQMTASSPTTLYQLGALAGTIIYLLTFIDITLGIAVMIACIGLSPELAVGSTENVRMEDFIVPALLLAWMARAAGRRESIAPIHIKGPMLAYLTVCTFATLIGITYGTTSPTNSLLFLGKVTEYFVILVIIVNNIRTAGEFKAMVAFTLIVAVVGSFYGVHAASGDDWVTEHRVSGPSGETANIFGGFLSLHIVLLVGLFLHVRTVGFRFAILSGIGALTGPFLYTYSRTSFSALIGSMLIFGIFKERRLLIVLLALAVLFPLVAPDTVYSRMATISTVVTAEGPESYQARKFAWRYAWIKFQRSPVYGFGMGSVPMARVDNEYVLVFLNSGGLGLAAFIWMLLRMLLKAIKLYNAPISGTYYKGFAAGYLMALLSMLIHSWGSTSFTSIRTMEGFMILTALAYSLLNHLEEWRVPLNENVSRERQLVREWA